MEPVLRWVLDDPEGSKILNLVITTSQLLKEARKAFYGQASYQNDIDIGNFNRGVSQATESINYFWVRYSLYMDGNKIGDGDMLSSTAFPMFNKADVIQSVRELTWKEIKNERNNMSSLAVNIDFFVRMTKEEADIFYAKDSKAK